MNWKHDLDALIESTMNFVQHVKRQHQPVSELPGALSTAEAMLGDEPCRELIKEPSGYVSPAEKVVAEPMKDVERCDQPFRELPADLSTTEETPASVLDPAEACASITPIVSSSSERDHIRARVNSFKAHQENIRRAREEYYLQMKAKMMPGGTSDMRERTNYRSGHHQVT
jgi:hypothetical protein